MEPLEVDDPRQVGRFEIVARLGSGGMGRVYLARLPSGEQFALKMIHQFLSDDVQFRRRFHREVAAAQRVTGENTAALVDADPDGRPPWMAVEYVDGPTLTEMIDRGGPLKLTSTVRLASGMAQALISIHAAGLVHRDLKPSNVLMGESGARLIDFGIAQASGASSLTMTGLVTGSAGFMSPEQAQAERVTEASDVFALGTVLYFAATGLRPFGEGSMISVTYRVVHADPDLTVIRDDGLRELIANCLMKDPTQRPTPQEILDRCPGIADGSWSIGHTAAPTMTTLAIGAAPEVTRVHAPLLLEEPTQTVAPQPLTMPTRREARTNSGSHAVIRPGNGGGRPDGLRGYASNPWLAIPLGAAAVLGVVTFVMVSLNGSPSTSPGANLGPVTEATADPGATAPEDLPPGQDKPSIIELPTENGDRPRPTRTSPSPSATATATATPSATRSVVATTTAPAPTTTKEPEPEPTTAAPTAEPTTPSPASPTDGTEG